MTPPTTLADRELLTRRLAALPTCWRDPLRRYADMRRLGSEHFECAIGRRHSGELERVRWGEGEAAYRLLLTEHDALSAVSHPGVIAHAWTLLRRGRTLYVATRWQEEPEPPAPIDVLMLLRQLACAARGVAALHEAGLVHGDLKPEVLLRSGEAAIVTDLKLAVPPGRRQAGGFTPKFAAPEQVLGEAVGPEADVYALGVTLYTLFIKDRFPPLLRTGGGTFEDEPVAAGPALSASTTFLPGRMTPPEVEGMVTHSRSEEVIIGAKVLFRSQLERVVAGVAHAELMSEILATIRKATDMDPKRRFRSANELANVLDDLVASVQ